MTSLYLFLLFTVSITRICDGQTCNVGSIYQCMKPNEPDPKTMQSLQEQCFISAGCTLPALSPDPFASCVQQIHTTIHTNVETCVLAKFPPSLGISLFNYDSHPVVNRREDQLYTMVNISCQNAGAASKVEACLRNVSRPMKMEPKRFGVNMTDYCEKKKKCMGSLPVNCTTEMKNLKNQICSCARSEILGNSLSMLGQLKACMSTTTSSPVVMTSGQPLSKLNSLIEGAKRNLGGFVKSLQDAVADETKLKMQHVLEDVVKTMCVEEKWDICSMISTKIGV